MINIKSPRYRDRTVLLARYRLPCGQDVKVKIIEQPKRYEWANISGEYKRDRSDWVMLCPSCHRKIDMGKEELCVL